MKNLAALLAVVAMTLTLTLAVRAWAVPVRQCVPENEKVLLAPLLTVTFDGEIAAPSGKLNRYATDAGVEFFVSAEVPIDPVTLDGGACGAGAKEVTVTFIDPWSGEPRTMVLGDAP